MSGTGKSSVISALASRGYKAIDTDDGWREQLADSRQMWREDAIQELLTTEDAEVLFVAGCEENQGRFHAQFFVRPDGGGRPAAGGASGSRRPWRIQVVVATPRVGGEGWDDGQVGW